MTAAGFQWDTAVDDNSTESDLNIQYNETLICMKRMLVIIVTVRSGSASSRKFSKKIFVTTSNLHISE